MFISIASSRKFIPRAVVHSIQIARMSSYADGRGYQKHSDVDIEPWGERLNRSMSAIRDIRGSNYVQFATVSETLQPAVRTVVFRGISSLEVMHQRVSAFNFITDRRSAKVEHIRHSHTGEIVWWMPSISEQYRFSCSILLVSGTETSTSLVQHRNKMWNSLHDSAREQFYWPSPGSPYCKEKLETALTSAHKSSSSLVPPDNFMLMLAIPYKVKYLRLTDNMSLVDEMNEETKALVHDLVSNDDDGPARSAVLIEEDEDNKEEEREDRRTLLATSWTSVQRLHA